MSEWDNETVIHTFRGTPLFCYGVSTDGCRVGDEYFLELMFKYRATVGEYEIWVKEIQSLECCEKSNIEFDETDGGPPKFYSVDDWDSVTVWHVKRGTLLFHTDVEAELKKAKKDSERLDKLLKIGGLRVVKFDSETETVRHYHLNDRQKIDKAIDKLEEQHD